jgi:hypothetical protein
MVARKADKRWGLKGYLSLIKGHCLDFNRGQPMLSQRGLRELARLLLERSCWVVTHCWNVARNAIFTARCQALFSCYIFLFRFKDLLMHQKAALLIT